MPLRGSNQEKLTIQNSKLEEKITMSEGFLGQIVWFAGNFAPKDWTFCNGALLPIASYQALFSLLGTTYGGDGRTRFALPDLRGRVPLSSGQGNDLSNYNLGEKGGFEGIQLTTSEIPSHTHQLVASSAGASTTDPKENILSKPGQNIYSSATTGLSNMNAASISSTGGLEHENRQPILGCNYIICLIGTYPSRN